MKLPVLNSCCGCISLEVGTILIAIFALISDSCAFIYYTMNTIVALKAATNDVIRQEIIKEAQWNLYTLLDVIMAIYLLVGIRKGRKSYMDAWVITQVAFLLISIFSDIIFAIYYCQFPASNSEQAGILPINLVQTGLHAFGILIVNSYAVSYEGREALSV